MDFSFFLKFCSSSVSSSSSGGISSSDGGSSDDGGSNSSRGCIPFRFAIIHNIVSSVYQLILTL